MANEAILNRIRSSFHVAFGVEENQIQIGSEPDDIDGWDSMGHVQLVAALEEEFKCQFDIDEIMDMETVQAIFDLVANK